MFVDLMVYDLKGEKEGVSTDDFEECFSEFLVNNYNMEDNDESTHEMALSIMKVREEFTQSAM